VKIEVYEESGDGVVSVASILYKNASYSAEYKSYLIDREKGLVGLNIVDNGCSKYKLLHFDGYSLHELVNVDLGASNLSLTRVVYLDGYLYIFADHDFKVVVVN
jgi:hypothetical protein